MRNIMIISLAALPLLAGGCVRTVASVVTAPVKVASQAADWATTSQDEADRAYGRKMREKEAAEGRKAKEEAKKEAQRREREARERDDDRH